MPEHQEHSHNFNWNPAEYLEFANPRLRPALDLLNQIQHVDPRHIYDLGCGPGTVTAVLKKRWPDARITGIDNSPEMLEQARHIQDNAIFWSQADVRHWQPEHKADIVYSNACLHWLDDHRTLFPRLLKTLNPGGVLAVQMPDNYHQHTHVLAREAATEGPWQERLGPKIRTNTVLSGEGYMAILSTITASVDIWRTCYYHVLGGDDPVTGWSKGTQLKPYLDACHDDRERDDFLALYGEKVRQAYKKQHNGTTILPFQRLFIVATAP